MLLRAWGTWVLLIICWVTWSGHYSLDHRFILGSGIASSLAVVLLALRMRLIDDENPPYQVSWRSLLYAPWLLWQVVIANIDVARAVLDPSLLRRRLIRVKASQRSELGYVIYANSITLTPGTVTLDLRDGELLVHAVTTNAAEGLQTGAMDRMVSWLEGSAKLPAGRGGTS
ncbi:MAG: Na+/H+ antiporter subunit E [Proteobacteria bacterium]|nr:Na+/H+ antiporter subunit E [Pseudomonadota bacterium]